MNTATIAPAGPPELRRALQSWQILLLALSGVIGMLIFSTSGAVLNTASIGGLLLGLLIVSSIAICVMTSLGELVVLWPIPNALVDYIKYFVDEDLSKVIGFAYWTFGHVEAVGGIIKFSFVFAGGLFFWVATAQMGSANNPSFAHNSAEAPSVATAICMSIPVLAFGFIGVEIVAVTAFEAKNRHALREPVRWIAWIIAGIYFWVAIPGAIFTETGVESLERLGQTPTFSTHPLKRQPAARLDPPNNSKAGVCQDYFPFIVLAAYQYGSRTAALFFNACIVYFCISSANTCLYVASRTLYGLARTETPVARKPKPWWKQIIPSRHFLGYVAPNGVPTWALVISAVSWVWLVGLRAAGTGIDVLEIMQTVGSVGGVMVWAAECFAFIKYYEWLSKYGDTLPNHYKRLDRRFSWQEYRPFLNSFQPFVAWTGLIGSLLIALVFCSASFWQAEATAVKVTAAYAGPILLFVIFIGLKLWRRFVSPTIEQPTGLELALLLEDLSRLPLDREPPAPSEDERRANRNPLQIIRDVFINKDRSKGVTVSQVEMVNTNGTGRSGIDPIESGDGVMRQRTLETDVSHYETRQM